MTHSIRPSSTKRAIGCPGHYNLAAKMPRRAERPSVYAAEGTVAHLIGELSLQDNLEPSSFIGRDYTEDGFQFVVSAEMIDAVQVYVDYVQDVVAFTEGSTMFLEERYSLDFLGVPELAGGTSDCTVIANHFIEVIDYKHGAGVQVYPEQNPQAMSYGLGAAEQHGMSDDAVVRLTIVQPRTASAGRDVNRGVNSWDTTVGALRLWAKDVLIPAAEETRLVDAMVRSGDHCHFCPAHADCPEQNRVLQEAAIDDFAGTIKDVALLSADEKVFILEHSSSIKKFLIAVEDKVQKELEEGSSSYTGSFKLVRGKTNRKFTEEASDDFSPLLDHLTEDELYGPRKLRGIGDITKALKAKGLKPKQCQEVIDSITEKPEGPITLAKESDKRQSVQQSALIEFQHLI